MLSHTGWAPGSNTRNLGLGQATLSSASCTQRFTANGQTLLQCQRIKDQQSTSIHLDKMSDGLFYSQRMNVNPPSPCLKPFNGLPGSSGKRPNSIARLSTISSPNQRLQLLFSHPIYSWPYGTFHLQAFAHVSLEFYSLSSLSGKFLLTLKACYSL